MKIVFLISVMSSLAVFSAGGENAEALRSKWKNWKDPLSQDEIAELMKRDMNVDPALVEKSNKARVPLESTVKFDAPATFLGRTFGEVRMVSTNSYMSIYNGILQCYHPIRRLDEAYFAFDHAIEYMSPQSHKLYELSLVYRDYASDSQGVHPLGRYKNGAQLLEEGRAILADLECKFGAPLQKFQFMSPIWPYVPGAKTSWNWGGSLPKYYICDESAWPTSRHASAISNTNLGRLNVRLALAISYYDEYSLSLRISDMVESARSKGEYEEEVRRRKGVVKKKDYEEDFPRIDVEFPE